MLKVVGSSRSLVWKLREEAAGEKKLISGNIIYLTKTMLCFNILCYINSLVIVVCLNLEATSAQSCCQLKCHSVLSL